MSDEVTRQAAEASADRNVDRESYDWMVRDRDNWQQRAETAERERTESRAEALQLRREYQAERAEVEATREERDAARAECVAVPEPSVVPVVIVAGIVGAGIVWRRCVYHD